MNLNSLQTLLKSLHNLGKNVWILALRGHASGEVQKHTTAILLERPTKE